MSNDFKEETHHIHETREPQSEEEIIRTLTEEFNSMFTRESVESNPYLIFKMNTNLEIPVTAIYKDKRISSICTNLAIIREALSNSHSVTYDRQKEILTPKIKAMRNKIILNKIPDAEKDALFKVIYQSPEYIQKISDKYIDNLKSYTIVLRSEEQADSLSEKIKAAAHKNTTLEIHQEYEDLYLDLLQKAQDILKYQSVHPEESGNAYGYDMYYQNYNYYYGMNPYMNSYGGRMVGGNPYSYRAMNNSNQYYNNYYNNMFIRKAQDETAEAEPQRGEYQGRHGRKKDKNNNKKPQYTKDASKKEHKEYTKNISDEEIKRRTRVNSENFPPLMSEESPEKAAPVVAKEEPVVEKPNLIVANENATKKKLRYDKDDMIKIFKENGAKIKANERLLKMNENTVPVLNLAAKPNLEFIDPSVIIRTPTQSAISRKPTEDQK